MRRLMLIGFFGAVSAIVLLVIVLVGDRYEIDLIWDPRATVLGVGLLAGLGLPIGIVWERRSREWTELAEPHRSRYRSLLIRYLGLYPLLLGSTIAVLILTYHGRLEFAVAMTATAVLLATLLSVAWFPMRRHLRAVWDEEERTRAGPQ